MVCRAACGTWRSPISAADLARSAISLDDVQVAGGTPYWVESRPQEGGRYVIVAPAAGAGASGLGTPALGTLGAIVELTPAGFNARTRVHEYGGRPYTVGRDRTIYFSHFTDQRVHVQRPGSAPIPLTPPGCRYADFELDPAGARLFCVREDHTGGGEPKNAIVMLQVGTDVTNANGAAAPASAPSASGTPSAAPGARGAPGTAGAPSTASAADAGTVLFADSDFVAYPRVSADGQRLAWIAWNHPDMPWDATRLYVAELAAHGIREPTPIAGGPGEAVLEPRWDADGTLYFVSDRTGWWNLYRYRDGRVEAVVILEAEIGGPPWWRSIARARSAHRPEPQPRRTRGPSPAPPRGRPQPTRLNSSTSRSLRFQTFRCSIGRPLSPSQPPPRRSPPSSQSISRRASTASCARQAR